MDRGRGLTGLRNHSRCSHVTSRILPPSTPSQACAAHFPSIGKYENKIIIVYNLAGVTFEMLWR